MIDFGLEGSCGSTPPGRWSSVACRSAKLRDYPYGRLKMQSTILLSQAYMRPSTKSAPTHTVMQAIMAR
jgi:hypothetical protein